jgi:hemerythrin superfamily protein
MDTEMDMNMDPVGQRAATGFPVAQPTEALRMDHAFVRQLFSRFLNTDNEAVRQEAGPRILELLEMHSSVEETVFYPQVRDLDESLIQEFVQEHGDADQLIQQLKSMDPCSPQAEPIYRRLCESVLHHIDEEEHDLFPKVEQANLDLEHIGLQMQAFEANLVSMQARESHSTRPRS